MRFSGVAKVGVPETQDILHCGCVINIVAQPADESSPVCPLTSLLPVPHWGGEMEVVARPSARHSQLKKQVRLCCWSVFTDRNQRSQPHLERPVWWECRSKGQRGSCCICFKQRPKRLTTGSPSASLRQQDIASIAFYFSLFKIILFLSSFHLEGKDILNREVPGNQLGFLEKHCYRQRKLCD